MRVRSAAAWLCAWLALNAAAAEPAQIAELRSLHARELAGLQSNALVSVLQAWTSYRDALGRLEQDARAAGDLDAVKTVLAERNRVGASASLTQADIVDLPPALKTLQVRMLQYLSDQHRRKSEAVSLLYNRYLTRLSALKKDLTRQGDLTAAEAAAAEEAAAAAAPAYQSALFALAEAATAAPPPVAADSVPVAPSAPPVNSPGVLVLPPGQLPTASSVRDLPLKAAPGTSDLMVRARSRVRKATESSDANRPRRSISQEEHSTAVELLLSLQRGAGAAATGQAVVEYFGRPAAGGAPRAVDVHRAAVTLGERIQYVEFPEVSVTSRRTEITWARGDGVGWDSGAEFSGLVVSIYDAADRLLWRGATDESLLALAAGLRAEQTPADDGPRGGPELIDGGGKVPVRTDRRRPQPRRR